MYPKMRDALINATLTNVACGRLSPLHNEDKFMDDKLFSELLDGVNEMVAIEKGEIQPPPDSVYSHDIPDVKERSIEVRSGSD